MTLIELLVVLAVVAILAMIAFPTYQNYVLKAHRQVAKADLLKLQLQLEHNYDAGYDWTGLITGGTCAICESEAQRYTFSITSSASKSYIITAKAKSGQTKDTCLDQNQTITIDSTNNASPSACWE